ncbi:MAG TPA: mannose-6-phosphate isomerase, class I [Candidatus Lumbricidophila sp.]|nr:mannose-6-phosphate isomerase, class I [Candidatus Lumbricidophila sp.]
MLVRIDNQPRDYVWGATEAIASFRGQTASGGPEAELWLGSHPGSPSQLLDPVAGGATNLFEWVRDEPSDALGDRLAASARLPFLLKVLAAAGPLSLQAHPTPAQAAAGFERENAAGVPLDAFDRNYKDAFHKPELIVAVSETFDALSGFRPLVEIDALVAALQDASTDAAAIAPLVARLAGPDPLRTTVDWLLSNRSSGDSAGTEPSEAQIVGDLVAAVVAAAAASADPRFALEFDTVGELAEAYPGDPGIVLALLLNRVRLNRGEALYLRAGNIHAYLSGLGIELMASSDNVLRGGLTPKYIDVPELLSVLDFTPGPPPLLVPECPRPGVQVFRPDVPDFVLYKVTPTDAPGGSVAIELPGPAIVLAEGAVHVVGASGASDLGQGDALYATPAEGALTLRGGVAWVASTNL